MADLTENLKSMSNWNHNTVADGIWLSEKTVDPIIENIYMLASAVDYISDFDFNNVLTEVNKGVSAYNWYTSIGDDLILSAKQGASASAWIYDNLSDLNNAKNNANSALNWIQTNSTRITNIENSAKSAYSWVNTNGPTVINNSLSGYHSYNWITGNSGGLSNSAKSGTLSYQWIVNNSGDINTTKTNANSALNWIQTNSIRITNIENSAKSAYSWVNTNGPTVINNSLSGYHSYNWITGNSGILSGNGVSGVSALNWIIGNSGDINTTKNNANSALNWVILNSGGLSNSARSGVSALNWITGTSDKFVRLSTNNQTVGTTSKPIYVDGGLAKQITSLDGLNFSNGDISSNSAVLTNLRVQNKIDGNIASAEFLKTEAIGSTYVNVMGTNTSLFYNSPSVKVNRNSLSATYVYGSQAKFTTVSGNLIGKSQKLDVTKINTVSAGYIPISLSSDPSTLRYYTGLTYGFNTGLNANILKVTGTVSSTSGNFIYANIATKLKSPSVVDGSNGEYIHGDNSITKIVRVSTLPNTLNVNTLYVM